MVRTYVLAAIFAGLEVQIVCDFGFLVPSPGSIVNKCSSNIHFIRPRPDADSSMELEITETFNLRIRVRSSNR